jgi:hypothetical protein
LIMLKYKVASWLAAGMVIIMISACGGGSGNGGSQNSSSSADHSIKMKSVACLNADNLEAGRIIRLKSVVNSLKAGDQNTTVFYRILSDDDNNVTDSFFASDTFIPLEGDNSRDINATLPVSIQSNTYRIVAIVDNEILGNEDFNISILDENLYAKTDALYVQANDGKPDLKATSLKISATDSVGATSRSAVSEPSTVLTLDFGTVNGNAILNSRAIAFVGALRIQNYIAKAEGFRVSACIDIEGSCKPIEIYSIDDSNQTHYDMFMAVGSIEPNYFKDAIFTGVIRKDLLNNIAAKVLKNKDFITTIKVSIGGIDESATQDPQKNSIAASVKFSPVFLSLSNIDNTNDRVALALSNYKLSMKSYIDDIKKIDPAYSVEVNSGGLNLFNPNLNWHLNNPIDNIKIQEQGVNIYTDDPIEFKPVVDSANIEMIKPNLIPQPEGVDEHNDPINDIQPVNDYISLLSIGNDISPALQGSIDNSDLVKETVSHKIFKASYVIPILQTGDAGLQGVLDVQARFDFNGAYFSANAYGEAFVIDSWYQIVGVEMVSQTTPANLEHTGYYFSFEFLGKNVYDQHRFVTEEQGVSTSKAPTMRQRIQENIDTLKNMNGDILSYNNTMGWADGIEGDDTFMAGPIPIAYGYGVSGQAGVHLKLNIKSIGMVDAGLTPYAKFDAYAWIGVGVTYHGFGVSTGIEGNLHIIDEQFLTGGSAGIKFIVGDDGINSYIGELNEFAINKFTGPWGDLCLYAKCTLLGKYTYQLWSSEMDTSTSIVLNKHQTLFKVALP